MAPEGPIAAQKGWPHWLLWFLGWGFFVVAWVASFDLDSSAALFQAGRGFGSCGFTDLDVVVDCRGAAGFRQARGYSFVLGHIGPAFESGYAALHMYLELVRADFRGRQFGPDGGFNGGIIAGDPQAGLESHRGYPVSLCISPLGTVVRVIDNDDLVAGKLRRVARFTMGCEISG